MPLLGRTVILHNGVLLESRKLIIPSIFLEAQQWAHVGLPSLEHCTWLDLCPSACPSKPSSIQQVESAGYVAGTEAQGMGYPACAEFTVWWRRQTGHPWDALTCRELHTLMGVHLCSIPKRSVSVGLVIISSLSGVEDALRKQGKWSDEGRPPWTGVGEIGGRHRQGG